LHGALLADDRHPAFGPHKSSVLIQHRIKADLRSRRDVHPFLHDDPAKPSVPSGRNPVEENRVFHAGEAMDAAVPPNDRPLQLAAGDDRTGADDAVQRAAAALLADEYETGICQRQEDKEEMTTITKDRQDRRATRPTSGGGRQQPSVEVLARRRLVERCAYAFSFDQVTFSYWQGTLTLRGRLPSFYLRQVLQTHLRNLDGVTQINNQVDVVSSTGLSSVRPK
jgi:hypothetical protein